MSPFNGITDALENAAAEEVVGEIGDRMGVTFCFDELSEQLFKLVDWERELVVSRQASEKLAFGFKVHRVGRIRVAAQLKFNESANQAPHGWGAEFADTVLALFQHDGDGKRVLREATGLEGAVNEDSGAVNEWFSGGKLIVQGAEEVDNIDPVHTADIVGSGRRVREARM